MNEPNGNGRTIHEWLMHIDQKLTHITDKLDGKVDYKEHHRLADRVDRIEDKTSNLQVKQAGTAGAISILVVWLKAHLFGA